MVVESFLSSLLLNTPLTVHPEISCSDCIELLKKHGFDQLPVVGDDGDVLGMVTMGNLTSQIVQGRVTLSHPIAKVIYRQFRQIDPRTRLSTLSKIFDNDHFALVVTTQRFYSTKKRALPAASSVQTVGDEPTFIEKKIVFGVVTRIDLLNYIVNNRATQ